MCVRVLFSRAVGHLICMAISRLIELFSASRLSSVELQPNFIWEMEMFVRLFKDEDEAMLHMPHATCHMLPSINITSAK